MMRLGRWHRWLGLALTAPLLIWIATGTFFLFRPSYEAAYADPEIQSYPLTQTADLPSHASWQEMRQLRTVLGHHLLVRTADGWRQLDPDTLEPRSRPSAGAIRELLTDAIGDDPRYGTIETIAADGIETSTGVHIELDWATLSLDQRGPDTRWIAWTYDMHSLRWTGVPSVDRALGALALALLGTSTVIGVRMALQPR